MLQIEIESSRRRRRRSGRRKKSVVSPRYRTNNTIGNQQIMGDGIEIQAIPASIRVFQVVATVLNTEFNCSV